MDSEEITQHFAAMNEGWLTYHQISVEDIPFDDPVPRGRALNQARTQFEQECHWLESRGLAWHSFPYDQEQHLFVLPEIDGQISAHGTGTSQP